MTINAYYNGNPAKGSTNISGGKKQIVSNLSSIVNNLRNINGVSNTDFTKCYLNGTSISNNKVITYGSGTLDIYFGKPLGYFNEDGQWVDLIPSMKLTDVFSDTHLAKGKDAAVNKDSYWLVQANDHRKNYGNDNCKFDTNAVQAFTPHSWGSFNYKYHVNTDGSLAGVGPVK